MSEIAFLDEILNARTFKPRIELTRQQWDVLDEVSKRDYERVSESLYLEKESVFLERKRYWDWEQEHWDDWLYE